MYYTKVFLVKIIKRHQKVHFIFKISNNFTLV